MGIRNKKAPTAAAVPAVVENTDDATPAIAAFADIAKDTPEAHEPDPADLVLIHFVADGFTALGTSWLKGQELSLSYTSGDYERTKDALGNSWLDLLGDEEAQKARWGKVFFVEGPSPTGSPERFGVPNPIESVRQ